MVENRSQNRISGGAMGREYIRYVLFVMSDSDIASAKTLRYRIGGDIAMGDSNAKWSDANEYKPLDGWG